MTIKTILIFIFLIFLFIFYILFKDKIAYLHANLINNLLNVTNTAESTIKEFDNSIFLPALWAGDLVDNFNHLSAMEQLCVSLLLGNAVLFSMLINIISLYYGNYLINKFNLLEKYPKLYYFIQYRKNLERYYYIYSVIMALLIMSIQVLFSLAVLFNW